MTALCPDCYPCERAIATGTSDWGRIVRRDEAALLLADMLATARADALRDAADVLHRYEGPEDVAYAEWLRDRAATEEKT